MAGCLQKFLPQTYTTVADCQEKKGSVRTKIIAVIYTNSGKASVREGESRRWGELVISNPVASELLVAEIRRRLGLCPYNIIFGRDKGQAVSSLVMSECNRN